MTQAEAPPSAMQSAQMLPQGGPSAGDRTTDLNTIEELFSRLTQTDDDEERREWRRQIIVAALSLADHIAHRFAGRGEPSEDLVQVARIGLIKSIDRYDSAKGGFLPYAFTTITGEVRRHFRDNAWLMHVPRGIKDTHRRVRAAIDPLSQRLGRAPYVSELATELDVDRQDISISIGAANAYHPISLEAATRASSNADDGVQSRHGSDDPRYGTVEDALSLSRSITGLSHRQKVILKMRFCDCLTQTEIAKSLGISQVHVSRLLTNTLEQLRAQLCDHAGALPAVN